jgi:hypothetical protein
MQLTRTKLSLLAVAATLLLLVLLLQVFVFKSSPSAADVPYSQNVQAVGEKKYVATWAKYGPEQVATTICGGRAGCSGPPAYWMVSHGTATIRATTFKVTEQVKAYDYYLLDVDVTTSGRSGNGDGANATFVVHSAGPTVHDRNDSKSINATKSSCTKVAVGMSTPWPLVTASTTVGNATLCSAGADLTRTYSGSDAHYRARMLSAVRHLTMQRWVKVASGAKPSFTVLITLPQEYCTKGDGHGHCRDYASSTRTAIVALGTTG